MDEVFGQAINEMFGQPFELLLGRKTYEIFAAHWPYAEGGEDDFIAKRFNSITKYVATRSTMEPTWKGSVALRFCDGSTHPGGGRAARSDEPRGLMAARPSNIRAGLVISQPGASPLGIASVRRVTLAAELYS
jgi:hypothetical protein